MVRAHTHKIPTKVVEFKTFKKDAEKFHSFAHVDMRQW